MRAFGPVLALLVPLGFASCGASDGTKAAIGTGIAVATVGIHRAITKDCWAYCSPGYLCNEESGLCELGECLPGCEFGKHCVRDVRGDQYCVSEGATRSTLSISPTQSLGFSSDAGAIDASVASADAATDASEEP